MTSRSKRSASERNAADASAAPAALSTFKVTASEGMKSSSIMHMSKTKHIASTAATKNNLNSLKLNKDCGACVACLNNRVVSKGTSQLDIAYLPCQGNIPSTFTAMNNATSIKAPASIATLHQTKSSNDTAQMSTMNSRSHLDGLKQTAKEAGVSPDNFENWRVLLKRAPTAYLMLQGNDANHNDKSSNCTTETVAKGIYGLPIPTPPTENVCSACVLPTTGDIDQDNPILLCDGCDREYHLQCLQPRYVSVPEGDFHCWDCSATGTTDALQEYLHHVEQGRTKYPNRAEYISALRQAVMNLIAQNNKYSGGKSRRRSKAGGVLEFTMPTSDLDLAHVQKVHEAIHSSLADGNGSPASSPRTSAAGDRVAADMDTVKNNGIGPDYMIGKPIELYFNDPKEGERFHSGRIVDYRTTMDDGETVEYLIRFPAGADYRKSPLTAWVALEEHAITVGTSLVWMEEKKGQWIPATVQLRTALSLILLQQPVPAMQSLEFELGRPRHSYRNTPTTKQSKRERITAWTKTFGAQPGLILRDMKSQAMPFTPDVNEKIPLGLDRLHLAGMMCRRSDEGSIDPNTKDVAATLSCRVVRMSSSLSRPAT
ncbi:hypothetical protein MPSEU_000882800 [Mayamaea pseudoterrestris]|nr:hypothetical protein MPSEU_000882800 [Mayamaea pseudoterrestris]